MNLDIIDMAPARVACLRHTGPYDSSLAEFWNEIFWPWARAKELAGGTCYGICHDNPELTPPEQCRYDACIEVPEDFEPDGLSTITALPGGQYAAMDFTGTADTIGDAWNALFREGLPHSGLQIDETRPIVEYYPPDANIDAATGTFACKLCVPVAGNATKENSVSVFS